MQRTWLLICSLLFVVGCTSPSAPVEIDTTPLLEYEKTLESTASSEPELLPPEAPDSPEKRATQVFWDAVQSGDGSSLGSLVPEGHEVKVILEHTIAMVDPQEFVYTGPREVQEWLTALHTPIGEFDMAWGDAFQVESSDGERFIWTCENMTCFLDGGIAHNTLFLNTVRFEKDAEGNLIIEEVQMIHGD